MVRVVYLSCIPLTAKVARDWYIDYLRESSVVNVEYWDITYLLRGQIIEHGQQSFEYIKDISSWASLEQSVIDHADSIFVLILPKIWQFRGVFHLLATHRCKTVVIKWGAIPSLGTTSRTAVLSWLSSPIMLISKIRNKFYSFILNHTSYTRPYDLVFAAGQAMTSGIESSHKTVAIGLCDYEQYVQSLQARQLINGKFAVFLDVYLPFHTDLGLVGMRPLKSNLYYAELNRFFSMIEHKYGIEVVIAAHPKARYNNDEFQGRKVIAEKTPELVRDAECVICHASTSVSYAVLNRKPVWVIYTDEMFNLYKRTYMHHVKALAAYLSVPLFNISLTDESLLPDFAPPSEARSIAYERDFVVTPGIEGGQSKEIFLREICLLSD